MKFSRFFLKRYCICICYCFGLISLFFNFFSLSLSRKKNLCLSNAIQIQLVFAMRKKYQTDYIAVFLICNTHDISA